MTSAVAYARVMDSVSIGSAAIKLTDKILGYNSDDLADILKAIASEVGLSHIAHLRFGADKGSGAGLLTAVVTYPREWQARYFLKQYLAIDPVVRHGRTALLPFDWEVLADDDPASLDFLADAARHSLGVTVCQSPYEIGKTRTRWFRLPATFPSWNGNRSKETT